MSDNVKTPGQLVVFNHPDGRELPAVLVSVDEKTGTASLCVFEPNYTDVGYSEPKDGEEPVRHTWHY